jgi:hypothetical protein
LIINILKNRIFFSLSRHKSTKKMPFFHQKPEQKKVGLSTEYQQYNRAFTKEISGLVSMGVAEVNPQGSVRVRR